MQQSVLKTVLVVDDEPLILMDLADTLADAGFAVVEASNADTAVRMFEGGLVVDMLVTDVDMPGKLNGLGLAAYVALSRPEIKIVITSGRVSLGDGLPPGAAFLPKPYLPRDIVGSLRRRAATAA